MASTGWLGKREVMPNNPAPTRSDWPLIRFHAACNSSCTLGHGSGSRFLKGAQSTAVMRSKMAALTDGRFCMRAHQSAMAG
jgi:hypothetical protein